MTYQEALSCIHSLRRFRADSSLARMSALMALLGNPQDTLKFVHVAGTNGKGSTAAMTAGILRAAGYRTGLYISPFILDFRERIQINDEMIPRETLAALVERVKPLAERVGEIKEFEFITALAFCYFAEQKCELVVLEAGMGGGSDSTNVIKNPLVCVITKIGLDHTEIFGDTVEKIAAEKCGIIKPGARIVTCAGQDTDAFAVILAHVLAQGGCVIQPAINAAEDVRADIDGTELTYNGLRLHIPLAGAHQIENALTALTVAEELSAHCGFGRVSQGSAIAEGIASVRFPARMEVVCRAPLTVVDGAHNPQGAAALADAFSLLGGRPVTAIMGMLADKAVDETLRLLAPRLKRVICVTPASPRALAAHALAARADALGLAASAAHGAQEAWDLASAVAAAEGGAVAVCGSLYAAAELRGVILAG